MSGIKKKVEFSEKNSVKKFKRQSDSENSDEDYDNNSDGECTSSKNKKHTLDSDEEDNSDQIVKLKRTALKGEDLH